MNILQNNPSSCLPESSFDSIPAKKDLVHLRSEICKATPLIFSDSLSKASGCKVWLKLENLHATHTYKLRAITEICLGLMLEKKTHFICIGLNTISLSIAYVGRKLKIPVSVFFPENEPKEGNFWNTLFRKLKFQDANMVQYGRTLADSEKVAMNFCKQLEGSFYISEQFINSGGIAYLSLITEAKAQLSISNITPDLILTSICSESELNSKNNKLKSNHSSADTSNQSFGSSTENKNHLNLEPDKPATDGKDKSIGDLDMSLLDGLLSGIDLVGWNQIPVVGVETFHNQKLHNLIKTPNDSRLSVLVNSHYVIPISVNPDLASHSARQFMSDHQYCLDSSSAAPLSLLYNSILKEISPSFNSNSVVLVILNSCFSSSFSSIANEHEKFSGSVPIMIRSGEHFLIRMTTEPNFLDSNTPMRRSLKSGTFSKIKSTTQPPKRKLSELAFSVDQHKKSKFIASGKTNLISIKNKAKSKLKAKNDTKKFIMLQSDPGLTHFQNFLHEPESKLYGNIQLHISPRQPPISTLVNNPLPPPGPAATATNLMGPNPPRPRRMISKPNILKQSSSAIISSGHNTKDENHAVSKKKSLPDPKNPKPPRSAIQASINSPTPSNLGLSTSQDIGKKMELKTTPNIDINSPSLIFPNFGESMGKINTDKDLLNSEEIISAYHYFSDPAFAPTMNDNIHELLQLELNSQLFNEQQTYSDIYGVPLNNSMVANVDNYNINVFQELDTNHIITNNSSPSQNFGPLFSQNPQTSFQLETEISNNAKNMNNN
ncbi:hypothetical protein BB560_004268 [Smittium megazygosporum]|uniref:L-serine ammonia-lyase n=1 Tax=Smittium megazygosporum TaxID=133381 RepID=A0A2T9Z9S7_9FUNG|nr:hypothetical protein BB560_004268 [Smittium megazygosporum]